MKDVVLLLKQNPTWEIEDLAKDRYLYFVANTIQGERWVVDKMTTTRDGKHNRTEIFNSADFDEALEVFITGQKPKESHGKTN